MHTHTRAHTHTHACSPWSITASALSSLMGSCVPAISGADSGGRNTCRGGLKPQLSPRGRVTKEEELKSLLVTARNLELHLRWQLPKLCACQIYIYIYTYKLRSILLIRTIRKSIHVIMRWTDLNRTACYGFHLLAAMWTWPCPTFTQAKSYLFHRLLWTPN